MAGMLRGLVPVLAWSLATGAAVTLSWWGVHTVMAGTAYDPPRALPLTAAGAAPPGTTAPGPTPGPPSSSKRPGPAGTASGTPAPSPTSDAPETAVTDPTPSPSVSSSAPSVPSPASPSPSPGHIKSYDSDGGRVVFDLGSASAALVSATPEPGWSMQVWKTDFWIRVEFTAGAQQVSVFCIWHDGPPHVEIGAY
ncbi:hypothetical protein [Streptomyces nodosus]